MNDEAEQAMSLASPSIHSSVSSHPTTWRLVPVIHAPGWQQMAIDIWLLAQHRAGLHPPTLRFYTWSSPTVSLGYHQRQIPQTWQQLSWRGVPIEVVRRPTGGRAVLHQGDLTYAIVTSGLKGNRTAIYQYICKFLVEGWRSIGVDLHYGQAGRGYIHNPNCFGTSTGADLLLSNGTKLIGSAQVYRGGAVLQHGSIRLNTDAELYAQIFGEPLPPLTLPNHLQADYSTQAITDALTEAAQVCFGIDLVIQPFSPAEWQEILATAEEMSVYAPLHLNQSDRQE